MRSLNPAPDTTVTTPPGGRAPSGSPQDPTSRTMKAHGTMSQSSSPVRKSFRKPEFQTRELKVSPFRSDSPGWAPGRLHRGAAVTSTARGQQPCTSRGDHGGRRKPVGTASYPQTQRQLAPWLQQRSPGPHAAPAPRPANRGPPVAPAGERLRGKHGLPPRPPIHSPACPCASRGAGVSRGRRQHLLDAPRGARWPPGARLPEAKNHGPRATSQHLLRSIPHRQIHNLKNGT